MIFLKLDNIEEFDKFISKIANIFKHNNKKIKNLILIIIYIYVILKNIIILIGC
jgi:hypothetical protein